MLWRKWKLLRLNLVIVGLRELGNLVTNKRKFIYQSNYAENDVKQKCSVRVARRANTSYWVRVFWLWPLIEDNFNLITWPPADWRSILTLSNTAQSLLLWTNFRKLFYVPVRVSVQWLLWWKCYNFTHECKTFLQLLSFNFLHEKHRIETLSFGAHFALSLSLSLSLSRYVDITIDLSKSFFLRGFSLRFFVVAHQAHLFSLR